VSFFFFKDINTFILQGPINLIKSDSKDTVAKISISEKNAVLLNFLFLNTTVFYIDDNKK